MFSTKTQDLKQLIKYKASADSTCNEVQQLINKGADITVSTKNGSLIDCVIREASRHEGISDRKQENCQRLIQILKDRASDLLAKCVFSTTGGNLTQITQLFRLHASCYQSEKFGPLDLLGELLKQETFPIRLEIVQFIVDNDREAKFALTKINDQKQTCLSLLKNNPRCPQDVKQFIQNTFDMILNQIPITNPQINVNEVVEWIYRGANPEAVDQYGNTVLLNAVIHNNQRLVDKLLSVCCNIAHVNNGNLTALQIAQNATPKNAQLETILIAQYFNIELKRLIETKKSSLTFNEVSALLEKGAKINAPIGNKGTFLHLLIVNEGTSEMVTAFINDLNADISVMDIHGNRPVELCILLDKTPFAVLQAYLRLPKISTDTFFNTKLNKSILQFAKEQNRIEATKIIQDALNIRLWNIIAQANTKDEHNQSRTNELRQLILYGAEIDHKHSDKEYQKWTVLHLACKGTTKLVVQYLIETMKANYTLTNKNGDYALSIAAEYGQLSIVQYLNRLPNVKLNVSNKDKQTPLHLATKNRHLLVVRYLVLWGADHQAQNSNNQTSLDIARTNIPKNNKDEITDKTLIHFLEQLICPRIDQTDQQQNNSKKLTYDLDTCELVKPIIVDPIQITSVGVEEIKGRQHENIVDPTPNDRLFNAAKQGSIEGAKAAIGKGANICCQRDNRYAFNVAEESITKYHEKSMSSKLTPLERQRYQTQMIGCQQIVELIRQIAYKRLTEGIENSEAYHVVAYHRAGAPLPTDLLRYSCSKSDNVQIVDYLINQSSDIFQAMFNYSTNESPYHIAKKNKFNNVVSYLKYRLSDECTKAIEKK